MPADRYSSGGATMMPRHPARRSSGPSAFQRSTPFPWRSPSSRRRQRRSSSKVCMSGSPSCSTGRITATARRRGRRRPNIPAAESGDAALSEDRRGDGQAALRAGQSFIPVLAPPWNRMRNDLLDKLPGIGIRGISAYGPQKSREPAPGLRQVNTHVDVVAWRRGRHFVGEEQALSTRSSGFAHRRAHRLAHAPRGA